MGQNEVKILDSFGLVLLLIGTLWNKENVIKNV